MEESKKPKPKTQLVLLTVVGVAGYALFVNVVGSTSQETMAEIDALIRDNALAHQLPRSVRRFRPDWLDLVQHYSLYLPLGVLVFFASEVTSRAINAVSFRVCLSLFLMFACGWAVFDEWVQIPVQGRDASWDDLAADIAGVLSGVALAALSMRWTRNRRLRQASLEPASAD